MTTYRENVYYSPDSHGLALVGEVELSEPSYSFDILAVWHDSEGYYLATDSGCSCPSPFEDYYSRDDLTGPLTAAQAWEEAQSLYETSYAYPYEPEEFAELLSKIV